MRPNSSTPWPRKSSIGRGKLATQSRHTRICDRARIKAAGIDYGSGPFDHKNMQINSARRGGRAFYFEDIDGHLLEVMTA